MGRLGARRTLGNRHPWTRGTADRLGVSREDERGSVPLEKSGVASSVAEVGAQGGELGAELGHFPLEAGEAVLGGGQLFRRFFVPRVD
jgi:hypothetical protein